MTARPWRIRVERHAQRLGWPGSVAVLLLVVAGGSGMAVRRAEAEIAAAALALARLPPVAEPPVPPPPSPAPAPAQRRLVPISDLPLVLGRIERAITASGVAWSSADYATVAANGDAPARVEVRFTLRAGYPAIRSSLRELLTSVPFSTLMELSIHRPGTEVADVEARIAVVVHLADDASRKSLVAGR